METTTKVNLWVWMSSRTCMYLYSPADDKMNGVGTYKWANGDIYVGGFKDGVSLCRLRGTEYIFRCAMDLGQ